MQDSYRSKYFQKSNTNDDINSNKSTQISRQYNFTSSSNRNRLENYTINESSFIDKFSDESKKPEKQSYSMMKTKKNIKENPNSIVKIDDEFSTYGTSRLIKTSMTHLLMSPKIDKSQEIGINLENIEFSNTSSRTNKEKDMRVKFSDEYETQIDNNNPDLYQYSKIFKNPINHRFSECFPEIENIKTDNFENQNFENNFENQPEIINQNRIQQTFSEIPINSNFKDDEKEKEDIIKKIRKIESKIKVLTKELNQLKCQLNEKYHSKLDSNEEIETEIEETEETVTKTLPIFKSLTVSNVEMFSDQRKNPKQFFNVFLDYDSFENERLAILEEILQENELTLKTQLMMLNNKTNENSIKENNNSEIDLIGNEEINNSNSFNEWFSEYNQSYSIEQRHFMESLYNSYEINKTDFIKLITGLLSKNVKSIGIQNDRILTTEKSTTTTNDSIKKHVYCGDFNSINVKIIDFSNLKSVSIQANPEMINKFTCPLVKNQTDQFTLTEKSIKTESVDIQHLIIMKNMSTGISRKHLSQQQQQQQSVVLKISNENLESIRNFNETENLKTKFFSRKFSESPVPTINHYLFKRTENRLLNLKRLTSPKLDEKNSKTRLEKYRVHTYSGRTNFNHYNRKRNPTKSLNQQLYSFSLKDSDSSHLNNFNSYMRNIILQGYHIPIVRNKDITSDSCDFKFGRLKSSNNPETFIDEIEFGDNK